TSVAGYPFLGRLPGDPIFGGPSGIAVAADGKAIVTDGNGELSNAFLYGPYEAPTAGAAVSAPGAGVSAALSRAGGTAAGSSGAAPTRLRGPGSASASEVSQHGGVRVSFQGSL